MSYGWTLVLTHLPSYWLCRSCCCCSHWFQHCIMDSWGSSGECSGDKHQGFSRRGNKRGRETRREEKRRATCINNTNANSPATQQPNVLYLLGFHFVTVVPERGRKSEGDKRSSWDWQSEIQNQIPFPRSVCQSLLPQERSQLRLLIPRSMALSFCLWVPLKWQTFYLLRLWISENGGGYIVNNNNTHTEIEKLLKVMWHGKEQIS